MSPSSKKPNPGHYPGQDRNADLQTLSFRALEAVLPVEKFNFRDERQNDRGVDASIELRLDSYPTNLRAQIQLKGTDSKKTNMDGSLSLQVETSNLNYLLNGPSPLYVCYIAPLNELRFLWAHDERQRIERSSPGWINQQSVTLRFIHMLSVEALDAIYNRVLQEGSFQRSVIETLSRSIPTEQTIIAIDPDTLKHTNPALLEDMLQKGGIASVGAGYAAGVVRNLNLLNPSRAESAYFQLLRAYAHYALARYNDALGAVQRAMLKRAELTEGNQQFLDLLHRSCELQAGRISLEEYKEFETTWQDQLRGEYALGWRLGYLRHALINTQELDERAELIRELHVVVEQINAEPNVSEPSKLQARISIYYAEGQQFLFEFLHKITFIKIRSGVEIFRDPQRNVQEIKQLAEQWAHGMKNMDAAINEAFSQQYPLLVAEGLVQRSIIIAGFFGNMHILGIGEHLPEPTATLESAVKGAEDAKDIYHRAENLEGEIRARAVCADLFFLLGREQEAQEIGLEILPQARIMGYLGLAAQAEGHANGRSMLKETLDRVREGTGDDNDVMIAQQSDAFMKEGAKTILVALGLPNSRLPVLERDMLSMRDIAHERIEWCRHIELIQSLSHTDNPDTFYLVDPDRYCICMKHKWQSLIGYPNWQVIINSFKQSYCAKCPDRDPKKER